MQSGHVAPQDLKAEEANQNVQDNNLMKKGKQKLSKEELRERRIKSGNVFITTFMGLLERNKPSKDVASHYIERVLHSILFLGKINTPPISPEEFLPRGLAQQLKNVFPKAFSEYNTHLPYYTPFSIVVEYMNKTLNPDDPRLFLKELQDFNTSLRFVFEEGNELIGNDFAASVVAYCCVKDCVDDKVLKKAYGASISCKGKIQKEIMIAISALHVWDRAISYAVYSAGKDSPIIFPECVHCHAYNFNSQKEMPPCNKCVKLYVVKFNPKHEANNRREDWLFGNCAENEVFSRLLQSDEDVRNQIYTMGDNRKKLKRDEIEKKFKEDYEEKTRNRAEQLLTSLNFNLTSEWKFFTPFNSIT